MRRYIGIIIVTILPRFITLTHALAMPESKLRIELFFKNPTDLRQRVKFLSKHGVKAFNLVNKSNKDTMLEWVDIIREEIPDSSICAHYSAKYNKCRKKDGAFILFNEFMEEMDCRTGENEVLVITGSGEKGRFNSLTALEKIRPIDRQGNIKPSNSSATQITTVAVAFNPFFPSDDLLREEQDRMMKKISTMQVDKVYLQFGTDLERLRTSLQWLSKIREEHPQAPNFTICGSIFLPTKKLIAQQKFRPWNGVFLCDEFLDSEDGARGIVLEMMRLYASHGCEILIEAPGVRNEKDMQIVEDLLRERGADVTSNSKKGGNEKNDVARESEGEHDNDDGEDRAKRRKIEGTEILPAVSSEMLGKPAILLFGSHDVRLHDNVAFQLSSYHSYVVPVFLWCKSDQGDWGVCGATEVVLKDALRKLHCKLQGSGLQLVCRSTDDFELALSQICTDVGAAAVYWNKEHTTESRSREVKSKKILKSMGIEGIECQSSLLYDPTSLSLAAGFRGGHWGTLMPFLRGCKKLGEPRRPIQRHLTFKLLDSMRGPDTWPDSTSIDDLDIAIIKGSQKWDEPILKRFSMSEDDALRTMNEFFLHGFHLYEKDRSRADLTHATSRLSAHLRIGTLSPNELYYKIEDSGLAYDDRKTISRRLFWRDLAYFQLLNFPNMREQCIRSHYDNTEWVSGREEKIRFEAWKNGQTGYPLVDAGMRELYATGWLTQSVRMVVASFLTEYLRVNWVKGCEWFHYTLVDADSAINPMMWQNAGRSGIDQWNFIMSPEAASQDESGAYMKKWVPELSGLSKPLLNKPWEAPAEVLLLAGIELGTTYPHRIVRDLKRERQETVNNVLNMRREHQQWNDKKGYDIISLPDGTETVVFTKKEFRIDRDGAIIKAIATKKKTKGSSKVGRGRQRRARKSVHDK